MNGAGPKLSIVIPSQRRADLLELCLKSVTRFAPIKTEIIVVDDGSKEAVIASTASRFAGVRIVRRAKSGGFCAAANAGIAAATAPIIEMLNDDTEVTAGWAEAALAHFADERIAAVAPLVLQNDPERRRRGLPPRIDTAGDDYDRGGFARKRDAGAIWKGDHMATAVSGASACAAFYRTSTLRAAGGFPEHFQAYFEDVDLSFRLRRLGFAIQFEPASVVWHRVSSSYGKRPARRTLEQQSCNEERVYWRNTHGRDRLKLLPRHLAVLAGKALRRWQDGNLIPWLLGRIRSAAG